MRFDFAPVAVNQCLHRPMHENSRVSCTDSYEITSFRQFRDADGDTWNMRCCILPLRAYVWPPVSYQAISPPQTSAWAQLIQLDQACGLFLSERIGELESTCLHRFSTYNMHFIFDLCLISSHNARTAVAKNTEIMENIFGGWLCGDIFYSVHLNLLFGSYIYIYI